MRLPAAVSQSPRLWLGAATALFICVKLAYIFLPMNALGMPRLGDDSLQYLRPAGQLVSGYDTSAPALSDILMQAGLDDGADDKRRWWRARVQKNTLGSHSPLYDVMNAAILSTGLSLKWAFAVSESLIAVAMGLGVAMFLNVLFGAPAAALGVVLLGFAILPSQGMQHFIASTLALSLALMLWAYMLRARDRVNPAVVLPAGAALLAIHPIAQIYLFVGVVAHLLMIGPSPAWWRRNVVVTTVGLGLLVITAQILPSYVTYLGVNAPAVQGGFDAGSGLMSNIIFAGFYLERLGGKYVPGILIIAFIAPFVAGREAIVRRPLIPVLAGLGIASVVSLFFYMPVFPAEVFSRLIVPLTVVFAGIAGVGLASALRSARPLALRAGAGVAALAVVALMVGPWYDRIAQNLEFRPNIIDETALAEQLGLLPDGTTIFYLEADVTLIASLLAGGSRHGALVAHMLHATPSLVLLVKARKPVLAAVPLPIALNMGHARNSHFLAERRNGFDFRYTSKLRIGGTGQPMARLYLWVTNPGGDPLTLRVHENPASESPVKGGREIAISPAHSGWVRIDSGARKLRGVLVELPERTGWIEGISPGLPEEHIRWPWNARLGVAYLERGAAEQEFKPMQFSIPSLFKASLASQYLPLVRLIRRKNPVLWDDSGIVFLNTVYSKFPYKHP